MHQRLETIYREHRQGLFTLALSITRSRQSAEDAVHDAFVRLWKSSARLGGDPVAYVFASVRNAALDLVRRQRTTTELCESIFDSRQPDPAAQVAESEQTERLGRIVDGLPDSQRETVVMRLYGGLTFQQIADATDEPLQTVASRYRRAVERIQREVEERP